MKKIYSLLVMMLLGIAAATAATSTLTFTKACGGSGTADDGAVWTVTSDGAESQYDGTRGIHYGTNKAAVTDITLTTSDIKGTITQVKVNATAASSANLSVTVGGAAFGGDAQAVSTSPADYTFTGSASGEIVVTLAKPESAVKALYVKSIEVTYSTGGETPEPATKYAVTISETSNGSVAANPTEAAEGTTVTLTVTPDQGYMLETLTVVDAEQTEITVTDNKFSMPASDVTVSATFVEKPASEGDILNYEVIGVTGTGYSEWTGREGASGAVYAGQTAGGNNSIQLRSKDSNSGIVSTTSGGKVKSVKITFNSNTDDARTVDVYGSNTAYTAATDLYGDNAGDKLGSATKSAGTEQTITVTGDYAYVGIRSASGAIYLDEIAIVWEAGETPEPATKYAVTISETTNGIVAANPTEAAEGTTVTLTVTPDQGYMLETLTVVDAEQTEIIVTDNKFTMPASDVTVSATFVEKPASEGDILNYEVIGVTGTNYSEWADINGASGAVYAGQTAGGNSSIQIRSDKNNSGIVSTTSGGKVKSVKITFNSNTGDTRTVDVYGSNTAYTAATDLYGDNAGTKLGSATKSDGAEQTITVTGDYAYVGIRSASGAIYLDEIAIVWEAGETPEPATKYAVTIGETTNGSVTANPTEAEEGATVTLTVTPGEGYELETLTVVDAEQNEITVTNNEFTMPASDVTVSATFVEETTPTPTPGGDYEWVSTAATDLATGDVVVIAETTAFYALANDNGTSAAPVATAITLNADDATKLAAEPAANLQWTVTVTVTDNGYSYQFAKDDTNYLYCTNTNNGVRVGGNTDNVFVISEEGYLYHTATSRYVGVYNNQDWRCYTLTKTGAFPANITDQTFTFFKKTAVQEEPEGVSLEEALAGNGGEGVTISNELTVVRVYNGYVYATDGNDNWVRLDGIENAAALTPGYVLDGNQVPANVQNAALAPAVAVNAELTGAEGTEPELEELDLANAPEALPKAGKVMKVTGYYLVIDGEPVFAAYGDKDQAEGHCIGLADAGTMLVGSGYDLEIFVELVEPWNSEEAAGAPRRLTAVDGAALRNIKGTMVADPEFATGVNSIAADGNAVSVKYVSVTGQVSNRPFEGMNIVVKTYSDGTTKTEKMIR